MYSTVQRFSCLFPAPACHYFSCFPVSAMSTAIHHRAFKWVASIAMAAGEPFVCCESFSLLSPVPSRPRPVSTVSTAVRHQLAESFTVLSLVPILSLRFCRSAAGVSSPRDTIVDAVREALADAFGEEFRDSKPLVTSATKPEFGDYQVWVSTLLLVLVLTLLSLLLLFLVVIW